MIVLPFTTLIAENTRWSNITGCNVNAAVPEGVEPGDELPDPLPEPESPPALPEPGIGLEIPTDAKGAGEGLVGAFPSMIAEVKFGSPHVTWEIREHPSRGISRIVVHASPVQDGTLTARVTLH